MVTKSTKLLTDGIASWFCVIVPKDALSGLKSKPDSTEYDIIQGHAGTFINSKEMEVQYDIMMDPVRDKLFLKKAKGGTGKVYSERGVYIGSG